MSLLDGDVFPSGRSLGLERAQLGPRCLLSRLRLSLGASIQKAKSGSRWATGPPAFPLRAGGRERGCGRLPVGLSRFEGASTAVLVLTHLLNLTVTAPPDHGPRSMQGPRGLHPPGGCLAGPDDVRPVRDGSVEQCLSISAADGRGCVGCVSTDLPAAPTSRCILTCC